MARRPEKDSATSQFFINLNDNVDLDHVPDGEFGYCVFGQVIAGFETINTIASLATHTVNDFNNVPIFPLAIKGIVDITNR